MRTGFPPYRFSVLQMDIMKRADLDTFSTANTGICRIELPGMNHERIEKVIYDTTVQPVQDSNWMFRKFLLLFEKQSPQS